MQRVDKWGWRPPGDWGPEYPLFDNERYPTPRHIFEAGADAIHRETIKWLDKHMTLINFFEEGKVKVAFTFPKEDWERFKDEK